MKVPTLKQIQEAFHQDVSLNNWRKAPDKGHDQLLYEGLQQEFFDLLIKMASEAQRRRAADVAKLTTKPAILKRAQLSRQICRRVQGLEELPKPTPLKAKVTAGFEGPFFRLEHVVFQSRPDFFVTGNVYRPAAVKGPYPAILHVCGHSQNGKDYYHRTAANLSAKGFLVLSIDPPGQGERDEYVDIATGQRTIDRACRTHSAAGDPIYLTGGNLGGYRLWDCVRALDYLQGRKDVIASKLGVTGTSGGGWEALWLSAIEPRIKAVSANCYVTTFLRRIEERFRDAEPDPEQDPFGLLACGMDMADIILACQPAAVLVGSTTRDFFPIDGAHKSFADAKKMYAKAGLGDRIAMVVDEAEHAFTLKMRQATYGWFQRWLMGRKPKEFDLSDHDVDEPAPGQLNCTATGIVLTSLGGKTTAQLNAEVARQQATARQKVIAKLDEEELREYVCDHLREVLRLSPATGSLKTKIGKARKIDHLLLTPVRIQSADGLWISGSLWQKPANQPLPAILWMQEKEATYNPLENFACRQLAEVGNVVLDLDVRGMGPTQEAWLDFVPLKDANLTYDAFLLGRPILGMRVADVLRATDWLQQQPSVQASRIGAVGRGYGALLALLSAGVEERIGMTVEMEGLANLSGLAYHRCYDWPVSFMPPGILRWMDLDTVRISLAPRLQVIVAPEDHLGQSLSRERIDEEFSDVLRAYTAQKAQANLLLLHDKSDLAKVPFQVTGRIAP